MLASQYFLKKYYFCSLIVIVNKHHIVRCTKFHLKYMIFLFYNFQFQFFGTNEMIIIGLGMCLSLFANYHILVSTSTICIHRSSFTQVWKNHQHFSAEYYFLCELATYFLLFNILYSYDDIESIFILWECTTLV